MFYKFNVMSEIHFTPLWNRKKQLALIFWDLIKGKNFQHVTKNITCKSKAVPIFSRNTAVNNYIVGFLQLIDSFHLSHSKKVWLQYNQGIPTYWNGTKFSSVWNWISSWMFQRSFSTSIKQDCFHSFYLNIFLLS